MTTTVQPIPIFYRQLKSELEGKALYKESRDIILDSLLQKLKKEQCEPYLLTKSFGEYAYTRVVGKKLATKLENPKAKATIKEIKKTMAFVRRDLKHIKLPHPLISFEYLPETAGGKRGGLTICYSDPNDPLIYIITFGRRVGGAMTVPTALFIFNPELLPKAVSIRDCTEFMVFDIEDIPKDSVLRGEDGKLVRYGDEKELPPWLYGIFKSERACVHSVLTYLMALGHPEITEQNTIEKTALIKKGNTKVKAKEKFTMVSLATNAPELF